MLSPLLPDSIARRDPRFFQIAALAGLLAYGMAFRGFDVGPIRVALILGAAIASQYACTRIFRLPSFDPKSALISGLSLCLLLRAGDPRLAVLAAALAVTSKFLLRWNGKHVFNPTNFAIAALLLWTDGAWVSPGQWGSAAFFAFLIACAGILVVTRAERADVTAAFLAAWLLLLFGRSLWLGEPMAIPVHRLESGALLLFAFFMISDPRTTPDSRSGRILFAALVAVGAWYIQFRLFRTNGLIWSLAFSSLFVPLIDAVLPGPRHSWKGTPHALSPEFPRLFPLPARVAAARPPVLRLLRGQGRREAL
jgi:Na+-transporting NADH:ubiquinone oxidoreductase subunit NqrB